MQILSGEIIGSCNKPMLYDFTFHEEVTNRAIIIYLHGFKGFKDWGHFPLMANYFALHGYPFFKFNFSHNGTTPASPTAITDLEAFGNNSISKELDDLRMVIDYLSVSHTHLPLDLIRLPLVLMGHSRGGGVAVLHAAGDERIKALITLAALSKFGNFFGEKRYAEWKTNGVMYVVNSRTGQQLPMYWQYMEDLETNANRLDILNKAKSIQIPSLIIHGTNDESVPDLHAVRLNEAIKGSKLCLIEGANHTFGGKHPYTDLLLPGHSVQWVSISLKFLDEIFVSEK
jgi:pimeloyl-ACP methyl ester carboxylesterase